MLTAGKKQGEGKSGVSEGAAGICAIKYRIGLCIRTRIRKGKRKRVYATKRVSIPERLCRANHQSDGDAKSTESERNSEKRVVSATTTANDASPANANGASVPDDAQRRSATNAAPYNGAQRRSAADANAPNGAKRKRATDATTEHPPDGAGVWICTDEYGNATATVDDGISTSHEYATAAILEKR